MFTNYFDIQKLINFDYLRETPPAEIKFLTPILIVCGVAFFASALCWWLRRKSNIPYRTAILTRLSYWLGIPPIIGLVLLFFRNQGIMFLSWRLWPMMLVVVWLVGLLTILSDVIFKLPHARHRYRVNNLKSKYIPKPKNLGG